MSDERYHVTDSPAALWLEPQCAEDTPEGRTYALNDDGPCQECGSGWVKYVRDDIGILAARENSALAWDKAMALALKLVGPMPLHVAPGSSSPSDYEKQAHDIRASIAAALRNFPNPYRSNS